MSMVLTAVPLARSDASGGSISGKMKGWFRSVPGRSFAGPTAGTMQDAMAGHAGPHPHAGIGHVLAATEEDRVAGQADDDRHDGRQKAEKTKENHIHAGWS